MANISKRPSGSYRVQIRRRGFCTLSKTFKSKKAAAEWARKTESELERSVYIDTSKANQIKFFDILNKYSNEVASTHKGFKQEQSRCRVVSAQLGKYFLNELTPQALTSYRDYRLNLVSTKTVREELLLVQRILNTCMKDWGITLPGHINPITLVRKPKVNNSRTRRLTTIETVQVCKEPIFHFAIETGMRRGEIAAMDWKDLDRERKVLTIPSTKNGQIRKIPLSEKAMQILHSQAQGLNLSFGSVWYCSADWITQKFSKMCKRENFTDLRFHDLRHEATSRFFEMGLNIMEVASITGHQDLRMLRRYTHLKAEKLSDLLRSKQNIKMVK